MEFQTTKLRRSPKKKEFDYNAEYDALARFEGTHPKIMKERIIRLNWKIVVDVRKTNMRFKYQLLYKIEKWCGVRLFEYKNYRIIEN